MVTCGSICQEEIHEFTARFDLMVSSRETKVRLYLKILKWNEIMKKKIEENEKGNY